jgi:hypothetical protein
MTTFCVSSKTGGVTGAVDEQAVGAVDLIR